MKKVTIAVALATLSAFAYASLPFTWTLMSSSVINDASTNQDPNQSPTHDWGNGGTDSWEISWSCTDNETMGVTGSTSTPPWSTNFTPLGSKTTSYTDSGSVAIPPGKTFRVRAKVAYRHGSESWTNGSVTPARSCMGNVVVGWDAWLD